MPVWENYLSERLKIAYNAAAKMGEWWAEQGISYG